MAIFFTGDHHFGHYNILKYCPNRIFSSIEEHDETLIERWNDRVKPNDWVIHLGDFGFNPEYNVSILKRLRGRKILVSGNHDERNLEDIEFKKYWIDIHRVYHETRVAYRGQTVKLVLCHYPLASFNGAFQGAFHLHGHTHSPPEKSKLPRMYHRKEVGVDTREDYGPWEKGELLDILSQDDFTTKGPKY